MLNFKATIAQFLMGRKALSSISVRTSFFLFHVKRKINAQHANTIDVFDFLL